MKDARLLSRRRDKPIVNIVRIAMVAIAVVISAPAPAMAADDDVFTPPPADAIVLFDGTGAGGWRHADGRDLSWPIEDGSLIVRPLSGNAVSRQTFEDFSLHLEFMCPEGGSSGNSGIYIFGTYEVQILNSWGRPPEAGGCGALYGFRAPSENAAREPGAWQAYDIEFIAPRWDEAGAKVSEARITVRHNGTHVHRDVRLAGPTGLGSPEQPGGGPIVLQDHGDRVRFRNIWIVRQPAWEGGGAPGFEALFDGHTLDGWRQHGGAAAYTVADDSIVGESRPHQPNSFLCTNEPYGDFVLELEFRVDRELNSGIQIRSSLNEEKNRVQGYQVEIDPSDRAWSAGIYEEGLRGWLHPLDTNEAARRAFRQDAWNRLRIVARGDVLRTYLNDVPAAMLVDDAAASGFIGLQVHGVGDRAEPLRVRWRDLRLKKLP